MIPEPNIEALKALLASDPVRVGGDNRKPVRRIMDENEQLFRTLADKGHTAEKVVEGFLIDFPELRGSRPDLDDDAYRRHVRDSYISFRRALGMRKPGTTAVRRTTRPKAKAPEARPVAAVVVKEPDVVVEKPAVVKTTPEPASKSTVGGIRIPTKDDL